MSSGLRRLAASLGSRGSRNSRRKGSQGSEGGKSTELTRGESTFTSVHAEDKKFSSDGQDASIYYHFIKPSRKPKAVLVFVHGFGEHSNRYPGELDAIAAAGFHVYALDHYSHGKSGGRPRAWFKMQYLLDDVVKFIDLVRADDPAYESVPLFVAGHSMGGMLTVFAAVNRPDVVNGIILLAPAIAAGADVNTAKIYGARLINAFAGKTVVEKLKEEQFCRDPTELKRLKEDPLAWHGGTRAGVGVNFFDFFAEMEKAEFLKPITKTAILAIHGAQDRITSPEKTEELVKRWPVEGGKFVRLPEAYHDLLAEPEKASVVRDMVDWMKEQVRALKSS